MDEQDLTVFDKTQTMQQTPTKNTKKRYQKESVQLLHKAASPCALQGKVHINSCPFKNTCDNLTHTKVKRANRRTNTLT